ncbi:unnamed protein product [Calicophoron daubneyi]|uniref:EF-hand domain-containing protein n=1 Tax=Calicophoron daubneyi TaxID=300641 RepID=A0AAV2TIK8_CALDB
MTQVTKEDFKRVFQKMDKDGSGKLSVKEIATAMEGFGSYFTEAEIQEFIKKYDKNGDNELDLNETINWFNTVIAKRRS